MTGRTAIATPELRFSLFGHARVEADGAPYPMATPRKTLQVLAYLLLNRGARIARSHLAYLVWPDETDEGARSRLRSTLFDLARVLPPAPEDSWLIVDASTVRWNESARVTTDVGDFEAALENVESHERAVALYTGDLLEAIYDEWLTAPRERLRSAYLATLERLVSHCRGRLEYAKAIDYAKRLLEADSLREDIVRTLIAVRYEAGDRAGAIEEFERFRKRVREELDIDPMPETKALRDAIARNDAIPPGDAPTVEPIRRLSPRTRMPFVGRAPELEQMLDAWSRATRGRGGTFFVGGEPGIGKSRLVMEFMREVEGRGGRVIFGATGSPELVPYQSFIEALRSALPFFHDLHLDGVRLASLATLLPELSATIAEVPALARIDTQSERARLWDSIARVIMALAKARPLLVVLEDLHWAGEATIDALSHLARRVLLAPVLLIVTYRDNETIGRHPLRRARVDAVAEDAARSLVLRHLSLEDVEALTQRMTDIRSDAADLYRASEGSPLLLGELLEGSVDLAVDGPSSVVAVIRERLDQLTPQARRLAEFAALAGPRFSREVVREAGGWTGSQFGEALDELLDRRIVSETLGRGALDYAFTHQMMRDVAEQASPLERAGDRHRRIARTFESLHPELIAEFAATLGRHYEIADDGDAAAARYLTAARRALELAAVGDGRTYVDKGLAIAKDVTLRKELLVERARVAQLSGDHKSLHETADALNLLADATHDDESRRTAAHLTLRFEVAMQDAAAIRRALDRLRDLVADAGAKWRAVYFLEEAQSAFGRGDLTALEAAGASALAEAQACGDGSCTARARTWLAEVANQRGHYDVGQDLLDQASLEAANVNDGAIEIESLRVSFMSAYVRGEVDLALMLSQRWLERATALGDRYAEASARLRFGIALVAGRRDFARARTELTHALATFEDLHWQRGIAAVLLNQGIMENEIGDFAAGVAHTERALAIFEALDDARGLATALGNLSTLHTAIDDGNAAVRVARRSLEISRAKGTPLTEALALENLASATAALGDTAGAIQLGNEALAAHGEMGLASRAGRFLGDIALWNAELGRLDVARALVDEMLARGDDIWAEWPQRCHWEAALILRATGDPQRAIDELAKARNFVSGLESQLTGEDLTRYQSVSWNAAIIAAHDRDEWPPVFASEQH
jgi:DNA-binding SARP family transcriptional activator/predicted ATPase